MKTIDQNNFSQHGGLLWFGHLCTNTCHRPEARPGISYFRKPGQVHLSFSKSQARYIFLKPGIYTFSKARPGALYFKPGTYVFSKVKPGTFYLEKSSQVHISIFKSQARYILFWKVKPGTSIFQIAEMKKIAFILNLFHTLTNQSSTWAHLDICIKTFPLNLFLLILIYNILVIF